MRSILVIFFCFWISGCALFNPPVPVEAVNSEAALSLSDELELYIYPQTSLADGYALRLKY